MSWGVLSPNSTEKRKRLQEILESLERQTLELRTDFSLIDGMSGELIFNMYCWKLFKIEAIYNKSFELLGQIFSVLSRTKDCQVNFSNGIVGFAWTLIHLNKEFQLKIECDSFLNRVDQFCQGIIPKLSAVHNYDLFHGTIGIGLYLLERELSKENYDALREILIGIDNMSQKDKASEDIKWFDQYSHYNLGLAHGVPSIVAFISRVLDKNIEKELCYSLIQKSLNGILAQKARNNSISFFPCAIDSSNNKILDPSRLAWCYGDLGIARSLWLAGKVTKNEEWKKEAINIMLHAAERKSLKENAVIDAGLCHGSAGISLIFNRFYWDTAIREFKDAALYWCKVTLDFARYQNGICIYESYCPPEKEGTTGKWENSTGLLEGSTGVGLALLSTVGIEPKWDRSLLLS